MLGKNRLISILLLAAVLVGACQPVLLQSSDLPESLTPPTAEPDAQNVELLGHICGSLLTVKLRSEYAYLGYTTELVVVDIEDPSQPRWLSELSLSSHAIAWDENFVYVGGKEGIHAIDMRDPSQPIHIASLALPQSIVELTVADGFAYAVSRSYLHIIELMPSGAMRQVSNLDLDTTLKEPVVVGHHLYVGGNSGLFVLDVSEPANPKQLIFHQLGAYVYGLAEADGFVYFVTQGQLYVVSGADPTKIEHAHPTEIEGWVADMVIEEGTIYLFAGDTVRIWDTTSSDQPASIDSYTMEGMIMALAVQDGYIFLADCDEGLRIFDTGVRTLLKVGSFRTLGYTIDVAVDEEYAYVLAGYNGGLHMIDLSDPTKSHSVSRHLARKNVFDFAIVDDYAYVAAVGGLYVLDIRIPTQPVVVGKQWLPQAANLFHTGSVVYVGNGVGDIWVFDVSTPTDLSFIVHYSELGLVHGMTIDEGTAYLPLLGEGVRLLAVQPNGELDQIGLIVKDARINKIALQDGIAYLASHENGLLIVDMHNVDTPQQISNYAAVDEVTDVVIADNYAYLTAGEDGLRVLDITDSALSYEVGHYNTSNFARAIAYADGIIYIADTDGGLVMLRFDQTLTSVEPPQSEGSTERLTGNAQIAFVNVNVIPMDRERILTEQTVIIRDGIIVTMGANDEVTVPADVQLIDATGKYLMPGLADMHIHLDEEAYLLLLLANGVTTVRNMDGTPEHLAWRGEIAEGSRIGPQIFTTGPTLDGLPWYYEVQIGLETPAGAAQVVGEHKKSGYDFIKVYDGLLSSSYRYIVEAAIEQQMPVVGHVPDALNVHQAILAGQRSIEHLDGYFGIYDDELPSAIDLTVEHGVWNCPTLIALQRFEPVGGPCTATQQTILDYIPKDVRARWYLPQDFDEEGYVYEPTHKAYCGLVQKLHEAQADLLLGTDAPKPCAVPGFAVHQELQNLTSCGLTPFEALQTATVNAAQFLGHADESGTVAVGQRADLILLAADPLEDVDHVRQLVGVMVDGRWFSRSQIERWLMEVAESK